MVDLRVAHGPTEPVAVGGARPLLASTLLRNAAAIAAVLPESSPGSHVAFAFASDRGAFAAALLGAWAAGHAVALPADARRESVAPVLERPDVVAFLHDIGVGRGIRVPHLLAEVTESQRPLHPCLPAQQTVLTADTTGRHGETLTSRLSAAELLDELGAWIDRLRLPRGASVVSTVTPTYLPGIVCGVLVPLCAGAVFSAETPVEPDTVAEHIRRTGAHLLVSAPSHLRCLARLVPGAMAPLVAIVATTPLDARTDQALRVDHGIEVVDTVRSTAASAEPDRAAALTAALLGVDGVEDAIALPAPDPAGGAPRLLAAVVAPALSDEQLRESLAGQPGVDEPGAVQRVAVLPRDPNGDVLAALTYLLFGLARNGRPPNRTLQWQELDMVRSDGKTTHAFRAELPDDYAYFDGHFPTYPVLAGAVQLHELVLPCLRRARPEAGALTQLTGVKFLARIAPGDVVEVTLRFDEGRNEVGFEISRAGTRCSTGRLSCAPGAGEPPE